MMTFCCRVVELCLSSNCIEVAAEALAPELRLRGKILTETSAVLLHDDSFCRKCRSTPWSRS